MSRCDLDLLTLKFYSTSGVMLKLGGLKTRDWKTRQQTAGLENVGKVMYGKSNGVLHM